MVTTRVSDFAQLYICYKCYPTKKTFLICRNSIFHILCNYSGKRQLRCQVCLCFISLKVKFFTWNLVNCRKSMCVPCFLMKLQQGSFHTRLFKNEINCYKTDHTMHLHIKYLVFTFALVWKNPVRRLFC